MWVLPVPDGPRAMTFSRRSTHSQRASSSTCILVSAGMALKSEVSRLLTAGKFGGLDPALDHAAFPPSRLQFDQTREELDMVQSFRRGLRTCRPSNVRITQRLTPAICVAAAAEP